MDTPSVPAVCAIFLASNLAKGRLTGGAYLVDHPVFGLISAHPVPDDGDFILWQSDGLAASGTNVTAHRLLSLDNPFKVVPSVLQD